MLLHGWRVSSLLKVCKKGCEEAQKLPLFLGCLQAGGTNADVLDQFGAGTGNVGPPGKL